MSITGADDDSIMILQEVGVMIIVLDKIGQITFTDLYGPLRIRRVSPCR